ncbi:MAG: hypothetical protein GX663_11315 [Clostridiales bacterium]|nr:hypothetical protein [Clostridiales bacterium]
MVRNMTSFETAKNLLSTYHKTGKAVSAVEMVVGLGVTVITLYIIILIAGSFSGAATSITTMPEAWRDVLNSTDAMAGSTFNIAALAPLAIAGVGILSIIIGGLYINRR